MTLYYNILNSRSKSCTNNYLSDVKDTGYWIDERIESDKNSLDTVCDQNEFVLFDNCALSRSVGRKVSDSSDIVLECKWTHLLGEQVKTSSEMYITRNILMEYIAGIRSDKVISDVKGSMRKFVGIVEEQKRVVSTDDVEGYSVSFENLRSLKDACGLSETDYQLFTIGAVLSKSCKTAIVTNDAGIIKAYSLISERVPELSIWSRLYGSDNNNNLHKVDEHTLRVMRRHKMDCIAESEKKRILEQAGFSYKNYQCA